MEPTKSTTGTLNLLSAAYSEDIFGWVRNSHRAVKGPDRIEKVHQGSIAGSSTLVRNGAESGSGDPSLVTYGMAFDLGHSCLN